MKQNIVTNINGFGITFTFKLWFTAQLKKIAPPHSI